MKEGVTAALTIKHHFYPGHILSTVWDLETQERSLGHDFQAVKSKKPIMVTEKLKDDTGKSSKHHTSNIEDP